MHAGPKQPLVSDFEDVSAGDGASVERDVGGAQESERLGAVVGDGLIKSEEDSRWRRPNRIHRRTVLLIFGKNQDKDKT